MDAFAVFGISNSGLNLAVELLILVLVVIYLALVYWTFADARRRIADPMLIGCAVVASLFPFIGTVVYTIVRPPEYLDDVRERELEMQAAEARLAQVGYHLCPHCDYEVDKDYLRCPSCMRKLKDPCRNCGKPLDPVWKLCPYCETEVGTVPPSPRRTRRRRETTDGPVREPVARESTIRDPLAREQVVRAPAPRAPEGAGGRAASSRDTVARGVPPETAAGQKRSPAG